MGTMYKEISVKKRMPVIVTIFIVISRMIAISNVLETIKIGSFSLGIVTNPVIGIITIGFIAFQVLRCNVSYNYSIIADQITIHRIKQNDHQAVKCINLRDIVYIGKPFSSKEKYNIVESNTFSCTLRKFNSLCCIYKTEQGYKKLYFQPSEKLVDKINNFIR